MLADRITDKVQVDQPVQVQLRHTEDMQGLNIMDNVKKGLVGYKDPFFVERAANCKWWSLRLVLKTKNTPLDLVFADYNV